MPELPEVEVLVRHLNRVLPGKKILHVEVLRPKSVRPNQPEEIETKLKGFQFVRVERRGKYLLFHCSGPRPSHSNLVIVGHLGMTGRMYVFGKIEPLPKHAAVVLDLGPERFVFEDTRYFGRFSLDLRAVSLLGPEPLGGGFTSKHLAFGFAKSRQPVKTRLLDQTMVAGIGNIYASEALFRAGISPRRKCYSLSALEVQDLWRSIRAVLRQAIAAGSTVPLNFAGAGSPDGLFYYGRGPGAPASYRERLLVYDRHGEPCERCGAAIRRITQAGRSSFFCPKCQR